MYQIIVREVKREMVKSKNYQIVGKDKEGKDSWGYREMEKEEDVERDVYRQTVETLSLENVIKAVNDI